MANQIVEALTLGWGLVGLLCVYYLARNVRRSWRRREHERREREPGDPARYLAERRVEQEGVLLAVGIVLAGSGVLTNFVDAPDLATADGWLRLGVRSGLALSQLGLAIHSFLVHKNYHHALNVLGAWRLKQQQIERRDRNIVANTAATLANTEATKANTEARRAAIPHPESEDKDESV